MFSSIFSFPVRFMFNRRHLSEPPSPSPLGQGTTTINRDRRSSQPIGPSPLGLSPLDLSPLPDRTMTISKRHTITISQLISLFHTAEGLKFFTMALHLQDIRALMRTSKVLSQALTAACLGHFPLNYLSKWACNGSLALVTTAACNIEMNSRLAALSCVQTGQSYRTAAITNPAPHNPAMHVRRHTYGGPITTKTPQIYACYSCFIGICPSCPQVWTTSSVDINQGKIEESMAYRYKAQSHLAAQPTNLRFNVKLCMDCFRTVGTKPKEIEKRHSDRREEFQVDYSGRIVARGVPLSFGTKLAPNQKKVMKFAPRSTGSL